MNFHLINERTGESIVRFQAASLEAAMDQMEAKFGEKLGGHVLCQFEEKVVMRWNVSRCMELGENHG